VDRKELSPEALMALSRAGVVSELVRRLSDSHSRRVRENVVIALARSSPHAVPPLMELMSSGNEAEGIRIHAVRGLGELQAVAAVDALIDALEHGASKLRIWSAWSLGKVGDERAVEPLRRAARDRDSGIRAYAVEALGCLRDSDVFDDLVHALHDKRRWFEGKPPRDSWPVTMPGRSHPCVKLRSASRGSAEG
jgi:HEAT repeat protein